MKSRKYFIILSFLIGAGVWILDLYVDYRLFFEGSFEKSYMSLVFGKAFYFHGLIFILFVSSVLVIDRFLQNQRKTQDNFKALENRYRLQFNQAVDGIAVCLAESGIITDCNDAIAKMTGRSKEDLIGQHQSILHPPQAIENGFSKTYRQHIDDISLPLDDVIITKEGELKKVSISANTFEYEGIKYMQGIFRDTTEIHKTKAELQSYNSILQSLIDSTDDATLISDKDALPVLWNKSYARVMKEALDIDMRKGLQPHKLLNDENAIAWWDSLHKRVLSGESFREVYSHEFGKDDTRYFEISYNPIIQNGEVSGFTEFTRDITQRKAAEEQLKLSEERLTVAIEGSSIGIWEMNFKNNASWVSPMYLELLGYEESEIGPAYEHWLTALHPEDKERVLIELDVLLKGKTPYDTEYRLKTKSRGFRWFKVKGHAVWDDTGKPFRILGSIQDINDLKLAREDLRVAHDRLEQRVQERTDELEMKYKELTDEIQARKKAEHALLESEQKFRYVAYCTADFIFEGDLRTNTLEWIGDIDRCLGYDQGEFPRTISGHMDHIHPDDKDALVKSVEGAVSSGEDFHASYRIRSSDGSYRYWDERGKALKFIDGKAVVWVGSVTDFTDKVLMEEEAKTNHSRLIQANKMTSLGTIASGVAHEINNPNSYIMSNSQMLLKIWEDAVQIIAEKYEADSTIKIGGIPFQKLVPLTPKLILGINEGSTRIKQIIDNLKNFARPGASRLDEKVDINDAVLTATTMIDSYIQKHTDNCRIMCGKHIPDIKGNFQQIEQVVINLTINAVQSLKDNNDKVLISTAYDSGLNSVLLKVEDEGEGIPADIIHSICEPFFSTKQDSGGTGLGLAITSTIINDHGGTMDFSPREGGGTRVTVTLPPFDREQRHV